MINRAEINIRISRFCENMTNIDPEWSEALIFSKVNMYYFTGTMQNGVLYIPRHSEPILFVRRSFERALKESYIKNIVKINGFKDMLEHIKIQSKSVHTEKEFVSIAHFERINKYLKYDYIKGADFAISKTRAVKSQYEIDCMTKAGSIHDCVLSSKVPLFLREGVSEAATGAFILSEMINMGHHGVTRINMFNTELFLGNVCFGESAINENSFDGPGGILGVAPSVPLFGNHNRLLKKGDVIFIDVGCGYEGYHTDKTAIYAFGEIPEIAYDYHQRCVEIQNEVAELMLPGAVPSEIYEKVMSKLSFEFDEHFMGLKHSKVKFLAHGIGLHIDEYPVIAKGFDEPLEENMVMAVEPKRAIPGVGMVGPENTFVVTKQGGKSITGNNFDIIKIEA